MSELFTGPALSALAQVIIIDLVLAGDNAIVIGMAAAGLPKEQRNKAILLGIAAATLMRLGFAGITTQLLQVIGLLLAGGILLLWVSWKMWRELRTSYAAETEAEAEVGRAVGSVIGYHVHADGTLAMPALAPAHQGRKTLRQAASQIIVADVSMSLDNVLAVAGAAREHPLVLVIGLVLSIALMGFAASVVARFLQKYRWIAYVGLAVILYVAVEMIWRGASEVLPVATALMRETLDG